MQLYEVILTDHAYTVFAESAMAARRMVIARAHQYQPELADQTGIGKKLSVSTYSEAGVKHLTLRFAALRTPIKHTIREWEAIAKAIVHTPAIIVGVEKMV